MGPSIARRAAARQRGEPIPAGWAINAVGEPTTNAQQAIEGILLPMAQQKGYVISMMMDVLAGVLTGRVRGAHGAIDRGDQGGAGRTGFRRGVLSRRDRKARNDIRQRAEGLALTDDTRADLAVIAGATGFASELPF